MAPNNGMFDWMNEPEDSSVIRPSDATDYSHDSSPGYNNAEMKATQEEERHSRLATQLLQDAMQKQAYISPSQGISAALLAAIPTLGGYLLGSTVDTPEIPKGVYGVDMSKNPSGAAYGGMLGAKGGEDAASMYFKSIQDEQDQQNAIRLKQAALEEKRADAAGAEAKQYQMAGLNKQAEKDLIPIREAANVNAQKQILQYKDGLDAVPESARGAMNKALGLPEDSKLTPSQYRSVTAAVEAGRKQSGQTFRQDQTLANKIIPGAKLIDGAMPDTNAVKLGRLAVQNYRNVKEVIVPELKRVFTDPNASTDEQSAALANAVIAFKKQDDMGASFTEMESKLEQAKLPKIAEINPGVFANFLKAELQGQNALAKINRIEQMTDQSVNIQLNPLGFEIDPMWRSKPSTSGTVIPATPTTAPGSAFNPSDPGFLEYKRKKYGN